MCHQTPVPTISKWLCFCAALLHQLQGENVVKKVKLCGESASQAGLEKKKEKILHPGTANCITEDTSIKQRAQGSPVEDFARWQKHTGAIPVP